MLINLANYSDIIGIVGVTFVLSAFFLLNTNHLTALMLRYQLLNFFGSWMILYSLLFHWNLASVLIEIAWISISLIGIVRIIVIKILKDEVWYSGLFITNLINLFSKNN